jgi:predicted ATP-dependent protease
VRAGALSLAGNGFVVIDVRDLMAQYTAWPLVKQALVARRAIPADPASATGRAAHVGLPVDARIVVTGDAAEYRTWCHLDSDVLQIVPVIHAFEPVIAVTAETARQFASQIAAIIASENLLPADGAAIAALMHERTDTASGQAMLSTGIDAVRATLILASRQVLAAGRPMIEAADILAALKSASDASPSGMQP